MVVDLQVKILRAAQRVLTPIARILLRNGLSALAFQELARKVFVEVANEEFGIEGRPQTVSRIAVLTGLSRKEVARLLEADPADESDVLFRNRAAQLISAWVIDPEFQDEKGDPLELPLEGTGPSFGGLVKKLSGDMQVRTIAEELIRNGALIETDGRFRLSRRGYVPLDDPSMMIDMLGTDTAELIETIDHNLQARGDKHLQAKVLAGNLPEAHLAEFLEYSKRLSRNLLEELARWLTQRDLGEDFTGEDRRFSAGLGVYHITRVVRDRTRLPMRHAKSVLKRTTKEN